MAYDHAVYCKQIGLKTLGFDPGPADGIDGTKTIKAFEKSKAARLGKGKNAASVPRPKPTTRAKTGVFGERGREASLKRVKLPWKMRIAWGGGYRTTLRLHKLIADKMIAALNEIKTLHGMDFVRKHGLDLFGGDYVNRSSRGATSPSDHSWGIALDLNPEANGLHHKWKPGAPAENGTCEMPTAAVKIFRKHGFQVGFRRSDGSRRDMMHIAYVDRL